LTHLQGDRQLCLSYGPRSPQLLNGVDSDAKALCLERFLLKRNVTKCDVTKIGKCISFGTSCSYLTYALPEYAPKQTAYECDEQILTITNYMELKTTPRGH
jgi:hypothetical protein